MNVGRMTSLLGPQKNVYLLVVETLTSFSSYSSAGERLHFKTDRPTDRPKPGHDISQSKRIAPCSETHSKADFYPSYIPSDLNHFRFGIPK